MKKDRICEVGYTTKGKLMKIIEYVDNKHILVEFEDGTITNTSYQSFKNGTVTHNTKYNGLIFNCVNGGYAEILSHNIGDAYCLVRFDNKENQICMVSLSNVKRSLVKNPWRPSVCNVGYIGMQYNGNISQEIAYKHWTKILSRCYNEKEPKYKFYGGNGVTVSDEWLCYKNFKEWFDSNYYEINNEDMVVDKDILFKGNKQYNSDKCVIIPKTINFIFTKSNKIRGEYPIGVSFHNKNKNYIATISKNNKTTHIGCFNTPQEAFEAYKKEKEKYIKQVADKYKEQIPQNAYEALYNYQVKITD